MTKGDQLDVYLKEGYTRQLSVNHGGSRICMSEGNHMDYGERHSKDGIKWKKLYCKPTDEQ